MTLARVRSPGGRIRILSVSDRGSTNAALDRRIASEHDFEWLGVCDSGEEAHARIKDLAPDIILLAIETAGADAAVWARALARGSPRSRVLLTSASVTPEVMERAADCGAWGLLCREDDPARIVEGIRSAARGEVALLREANEAQRLADRRMMHEGWASGKRDAGRERA